MTGEKCMQSTIPSPDYEDPKEIYAFFGLTFYAAQVLEQGVVNLAVALMAAGDSNLTSQIVLDLYDDVGTKTFGRVLQIARDHMTIPGTIDADLSVAMKKRNHLAHHFFVEHDHDILTNAGRRNCIDLLIDDLKFFKRVDTDFDPIWQGAWARFGVTQDVLNRILEKLGVDRLAGGTDSRPKR
jgi:hypothetical protein